MMPVFLKCVFVSCVFVTHLFVFQKKSKMHMIRLEFRKLNKKQTPYDMLKLFPFLPMITQPDVRQVTADDCTVYFIPQ